MKGLSILLIVIAVIAVVASSAMFIVDEREQTLVLAFGKYKETHSEPGLKFKIPFVEDVLYYPKQAILLDYKLGKEIILQGDKRLTVDVYAYYRITDPLLFYKNLINLDVAEKQIVSQIESATRDVLGQYRLDDILSPKRADMMQQIYTIVNRALADKGISMLDVRLRRMDLPQANTERIVQLMISDREKKARDLRAKGEKDAQETRSKAEKERTVMLATAEAEAQKIRGEGDATAIKTYADAFSADPKFFAFYRSLDAYKKALSGDTTTFVLSPDSEFFEFLNESQ